MKLTLKNIGKIEKAAIEYNGITVIAGENNTGKSTVGKALFAVCNSFFELDKKIEFERRKSVEGILSRIRFGGGSRFLRTLEENALAGKIIRKCSERVNKATDLDLQDEIAAVIKGYDENIAKNVDEELIYDVSSNILASLQVPDHSIFVSILETKLNAEFNQQISNVYNEKNGEIELECKNKTFSIMVKEKNITHVSKDVVLPFIADAIYLDDPFVLVDYRIVLQNFFSGIRDHQIDLQSKLSKTNERVNIVDGIIAGEKLKDVTDKISEACSGDIIFDKGHFSYRKKGTEKTLNLHNLSTGIKSFVILKMLIQNGTLRHGAVLILDEPEIHLHPEWQLLFAEIIVLLQKEFGLFVLLNTHSPYFLRAIEVYAAKHNVADKCKYYLAENVKDKAIITDVTNDIEKIYEKLARPLQTLEDERWKDAEPD
jgi:predicted ATPase